MHIGRLLLSGFSRFRKPKNILLTHRRNMGDQGHKSWRTATQRRNWGTKFWGVVVITHLPKTHVASHRTDVETAWKFAGACWCCSISHICIHFLSIKCFSKICSPSQKTKVTFNLTNAWVPISGCTTRTMKRVAKTTKRRKWEGKRQGHRVATRLGMLFAIHFARNLFALILLHCRAKLCSHWHKQNCDASTPIINPCRSAKHGFEAVQKKNGQAASRWSPNSFVYSRVPGRKPEARVFGK